jgi:rod shape-determining protein MreD
MKKVVILFFINLALVLLQQSFLSVLFDYRYFVNLYLAFVIALFVQEREEEALLSALVGGLITDLLTTGPIGLSSLLVSAMLLVLRFTKKFFYRNWLVRTLLALIVFYIYTVVTNFQTRENIEHILISCLITLGFSFIFKFMIDRIFHEKRFS